MRAFTEGKHWEEPSLEVANSPTGNTSEENIQESFRVLGEREYGKDMESRASSLFSNEKGDSKV